MASAFDWITLVCSVIATVATLVTLLTVYLAAVQMITQRRVYRLGISPKSLGPWRSKVVSSSALRFQTKISVPRVSLPMLVKKGWEPQLSFPTGFSVTRQMAHGDDSVQDLETPVEKCWTLLSSAFSCGFSRGRGCCSQYEEADHDPEILLPETSWVNFLEALGLRPTDNSLYQMRYESELVNGIVPMRWKGKDLVGVCSVLGFQSFEKEPSHRDPMPLPMQWSGPLGWLQFRASAEGCIVEFRRRAEIPPQLSKDLHLYFEKLSITILPYRKLVPRLWHTINGLYLDDKRTLYLGPTDDDSDDESEDETGGEGSGDGDDAKAEGDGSTSEGDGEKESDDDDEKLDVFSECPGLLSEIEEGELADSRGLDISTCLEYNRVRVVPGEWDPSTHPFQIGTLRMEKKLLQLIKEAVMRLQPDGFFFTPTDGLFDDVSEFFTHVADASSKLNDNLGHCAANSEKLKHIIFPRSSVADWKKHGSQWETLYYAMALCNEFQRIKKGARADFTVHDMRIISKAAESLRDILQDRIELVWALVISPKLFSKMIRLYGKMKVGAVVGFEVRGEGEVIYVDSKTEFKVPLLTIGGAFKSEQVLAAFAHVLILYFWVDKRWINSVGLYDPTIPQSVTMC